MSKIRVRYLKTGKAKYISHLDLMTTMQRAFIRSGFRLKYSEGFNPHPYISVALPLPVGCGSVCELMDIGLHDEEQAKEIQADKIQAKEILADEIKNRVNQSLPEGICISEVYASDRKFSDISWIDISGEMVYDNVAPAGARERLAALFSRGSIIIEKKTKRGLGKIDVAPHIRDISVFNGDAEGDEGNTIMLTVKVSASNPTINTDNVMSIINSGDEPLRPDYAVFTRLKLFDEELIEFR